MSRKVFISFLGTSNYVQCMYVIDGEASEPVRFVQEALIAHLCKEWTEEDKILIFHTSEDSNGEKGSKEINWFDNGHPKVNDESERVGLKHRLEDLRERVAIRAKIEDYDIEAGFSEEETWNIFDTVYSKLEEGDEIYFDVTHAFRSIPLFSIVLFNYAKFMKKTNLKSIMYGAFEKLGPAFKVREMPVEERLAPVIDLTNIARLQEYNQVASSLKDFGRVKMLHEAIDANVETSTVITVRYLSESISELDQYIETIDLKAIKSGNFICKFRNNFKNVRKKGNLSKPILKILDELNRETEDFVENNDFQNIEAAINWTIKHDMLMQTYPLVAEYIILRFSEKYKHLRPKGFGNKDFRFFVSSILGAPEENFINKNWKESISSHSEIADVIADDTTVIDVRSFYASIREARNSLAHGNGAIKYEELIKGITGVIKGISRLNPEYENYPSTQEIIKQYVH